MTTFYDRARPLGDKGLTSTAPEAHLRGRFVIKLPFVNPFIGVIAALWLTLADRLELSCRSRASIE